MKKITSAVLGLSMTLAVAAVSFAQTAAPAASMAGFMASPKLFFLQSRRHCSARVSPEHPVQIPAVRRFPFAEHPQQYAV